MNPRRVRTLALVVAWWGAWLGTAAASPTPETTADPIVAEVHDRAADILGGLVRGKRSSFAAIVFIQQGQLQFALSYGRENPATPTAFSTDATLVDLNSINKVLTAVAVAQLISRGTIHSVDDPVNQYLKHFKLPLAFGREVTIREIATHSAGLDLEAFPPGPFDTEPVEFFRHHLPDYFYNPGKFSSYDNFGPRLLSYMVSEITDQPATRYIENSVLHPLGMNHTFLTATPQAVDHRIVSFQVPAPENTGAGPPLYQEGAATLGGVAVSTMSDIALLIAALTGPAEEQHVITQPMRDLMFTILQSNGNGGSSRGLLFDAVRTATTPFFTHGGKGPGISCMLVIDPVRRAGAFFCYGDVHTRFRNNPAFSPPTYEEVTGKIIEPFKRHPGEAANPATSPSGSPAQWNDHWNRYLGLYIDIARHHYGFSSLRTILTSSSFRLERSGSTLRLADHDGFVEIEPGLFASPRHLETFSIKEEPATGKIMLSTSDRPSAFEHVSTWQNPKLIAYLLAGLVIIAASGGLYVILPVYGLDARSRLAVLAYLLVVACGLFTMYGLRAFGARYYDGISWPLHLLRGCAFLTLPASVYLIVATRRADRTRLIGIARWGRVHLNIICASSIALVITLLAIHLIGFTRIT